MLRERLQSFALSFFSIAIISNGCITHPEDIIEAGEIKEHVQYLASDALKGRKTGTPELDSAANYIANYFRVKKLTPLAFQNSFHQEVRLRERPSEPMVSMTLDKFTIPPEDIIYFQGTVGKTADDLLWIDSRTIITMDAAKLQNKILITDAGIENRGQITDYLLNPDLKSDQLIRLGAKGLVEVYNDTEYSWRYLKKYTGMLRMYLDRGQAYNDFLHILIREQKDKSFTRDGGLTARFTIPKTQAKALTSYNIVGLIPGRHPVLKDEYILLTAHYDHIGIGKPIQRLDGEMDSIYNGARDNAVGTAALMLAGRVLAKYPSDRSVILMACTAEEAGLLGSAWYLQHPLVPLEKTVFNLNIDGASYNDTGIATVIGLHRTTAMSELTKACSKFGLEAYTSQEIEDQLYQRSDNQVFARAGIPSITFSIGLRQFDSKIRDHYHQPTDEADQLDYDYLEKWTRALVYSVRTIADMENAPEWADPASSESQGIPVDAAEK